MGTKAIGQLGCLVALVAGANLGCGAMKGGDAKEPKAAEANTLEVTNATDQTFCEVYAHFDADDDAEGGWGENFLEAGKQLAPGEKMTIPIVGEKLGLIDFMAKDCDGNIILRRHDFHYIDPGKNELAVELPKEPDTPLAAPSESEETEVYLYVKNDCSDKVEYCAIEPSGTQNKSDLSGGSQQQFQWEIGTAIKQRSGESCGDLIHTVTADDKDQTIVICQ